jgi:DNA-binding MarR family transcriptional regulator
MDTGTGPEDDRVRVDSSRRMSVEAYRALLTQRLRAESAVGTDAAGHAELVFNLTRLHTRISQDFEVLHRRRGWTWSGFRIMNVLWVFGTMEQRDVARLSGGSRAAISSALNTLQRDGLVDRIRDSSLDRRVVRLELTERGRSVLRDAIREQADRERQWLSVLSSSDQRLLSQLLAAVADRRTP